MRLLAFFCHILLCALIFCPLSASAKDVLRFAVFDDGRSKEVVEKTYQPVVEAIEAHVPDVVVQLHVMSQEEMNEHVQSGSIDILTTNPPHYLLLRAKYGIENLLATQVNGVNGTRTPLAGGVIFTRKDRNDINNLKDLKARIIACRKGYILGCYMSQAYELHKIGVSIQETKAILSNNTPEEVVESVMTGRADAGFIATGLLESMFLKGMVKQEDIKIINARQYAGFPFLVSTDLYPGWAVAALPHVNSQLVSRIKTALYGINIQKGEGDGPYLAGYTLPLSYSFVEAMLTQLRISPFGTMEILWDQLLHANKWQAYLILGGLLLICCLLLLLGLALYNAGEEKRRMRAMLNGMPYPGLLVNREHRIIAMNSAANELFNTKEGAYCWEQLWHCEFLPDKKGGHYEFHDPNTTMRCSFCRSEDALTTGKTVHCELVIQNRWWDSWWVPIDPLMFLHYFVDITEYKDREKELQEAQHFLREIADTVQDMIWVKDVNKRYLFANKAICEKLLCAQNTQEPIGKTDLFFAERIRAERPEDKTWHTFGEICQNSDEVVISTGKPGRFEEDGNVRGKYLCLDVIKVPLFDEKGRITAIVGSARDITRDKELQQEKELLEKKLQQSAKMEALGIMVGGIAHNFNNLLQVIAGYTQLLEQRMSAKDEVTRRGLNQIGQACEKAAALVRSLMAFSRKTEYVSTELNLNDEVLTVQEILENTLPKTIKLEIHLEQKLWTIKANSTQIQTVLLNLTNNARDAMPDGGVLRIATRNIAVQGQLEGQNKISHSAEVSPLTAGDYVLLEVSDTGCGMSEEVLKHLFEPFFTTKPVNQGTGLGLSTVYGIVRAYGGDIFCKSAQGKGTSFEIYLPAVSRETLPLSDRSVLSEPPSLTSQTKDKTILLVDDEEAIRSLTRQALESAGYRVLEAESGEKALELYEAEANGIHLVILDLNMPGMSGHVCLQRLLEMNRDVRVLVASGYSDKGMEDTVLSQGAAGFLAKPFKLDGLLKKVEEAAAF